MLQWPAANVFKPLQGCFKASAAGVFKRLRRVFIKVAPLSGYLKDYLFGGLIELSASVLQTALILSPETMYQLCGPFA